MCRNIKPLFNFDPPATEAEIHASVVQFVRKVSGSPNPSKANEAPVQRAVEEITQSVTQLLSSLTTTAKPKNREIEAEKARGRAARRFGTAEHSPGDTSSVSR